RVLAAAATALVAAGALLVWFTGAAAWIEAGVAANHYGNQPHLVRTVRDAAIGLALTPVLFLMLHLALAGRSRPASLFGPMPSAPRVLALVAALNVALLVFFVR